MGNLVRKDLAKGNALLREIVLDKENQWQMIRKLLIVLITTCFLKVLEMLYRSYASCMC